MTRTKVAVVRARPDHILDDIDRLHDLAGVEQAFRAGATTILKDNISWHFPFPGANTTPWQLEGTIRSLRARGYTDLVCVQNKTVVTDAFKGEDLNGYIPIFKRYEIPVRYNFKPEDMTWSNYRPKAKMRVLDTIFPEGIQIPDAFHDTNIVHLPTTKCVAGDTRIMLGDGSVITIRELVEHKIAAAGLVVLDSDGTVHVDGDASVFAMDSLGHVRPMRATHFARTRRGDRRVLRIVMKSGRSIVATADHPLFGEAGWTNTGDLQIGTRVAIARRLQRVSRVIHQPHDSTALALQAEWEPSIVINEDLAWDHVDTIDDVAGDLDVYDLTVPEAGSFIANGIVAHNCHIYTTTTGAMKNAFGGLLNTKRHYTHSWIHETLVDLLAIQKEIHAGLFAVMDGTTAGDGPGPRTMRPVIKDVLLASEDQVAIDAVAAQMMGFDPMSLPYIKLADEAGLGNGRRENIEVVGDVALADERWGFSVGDNGASMVGDVMWFGPLKRFQKLFFHTPLVNLFVMGSEAYHDYYRWPLRDRRVFEQWRESTSWGQLFDYYQSHGTLAPSETAADQAG
jgi:uncharacterized protein (DUF362 family)